MEHGYCAESDTILIRPLHEKDIENLRIWRNSEGLSKYLSKIPYISSEMQNEWYQKYLKDKDTLFFGVIDKSANKLVGSVSLYGFRKKSCEVGRIVVGDPSVHGKGVGYGSLILAIEIGFQIFKLDLIKLDVHELNEPAKRLYEKAGFRTVGVHPFPRGGKELEMEILESEFYNKNTSIKGIRVFEEDSTMVANNVYGGVLPKDYKCGINCYVAPGAVLEKGVELGHNCIVEDDVFIDKGTYIDSNTIIRSGTKLGSNSFVGSNCIIGEYQNDYIHAGRKVNYHLEIGDNALIRSGTIIYSNSVIGVGFQTGHHVTIRESSEIGDHVSLGTLSDIQGLCKIGNYVRLHSNVHIGQHSIIDNFVWIFPYVVLTNDPTPPSDQLIGVHIHSFAIVATGSVLLPGVDIAQDALIGAGAIVTKDVGAYKVAVGNPAKEISDVRKIKNRFTGEPAYPWRYYYSNNMPWCGTSFKEWYAELDEAVKGLLGLGTSKMDVYQ